ncbi:S8 family serine peptidase [Bacillus cereus]|uniref:S8 family serine peptidase n=1 Tax=Bacillus cereus TaxID=1396 RepID=UPI001CEF8FB3|nr:S8 family serine peptidase [Bacillus cereus]
MGKPYIYAEAVVKSEGGLSLFEITNSNISSKNIMNFFSSNELVNQATQRLLDEGFNVLHTNSISITIAAPIEVYEEVFKTKILKKEKIKQTNSNEIDKKTYFDTLDTHIRGLIDTSKSSLADVLEGIAIEEPGHYISSINHSHQITDNLTNIKELLPTAFPPSKSYWHLNVPADVSLGINADKTHRLGITGKGIKVIMVDSGWYRHPFFVERGYQVKPVVLGVNVENPDHDEVGHGTGESANIFSIAPDVDFTMVKANENYLSASFKIAVDLEPDIISCSWYTEEVEPDSELSAAGRVLAATIAYAVNKGITVIFAGGNDHWAFPGQHPDVISVGGTYMHTDGTFEATSFASGFSSPIYKERNCPDVCGLVGVKPKAQYIMLPVEPNSIHDDIFSGGKHPQGDETLNNDGWAAFSGTSAAAPQIAGICALMKQVSPDLSPIQLKHVLKETARDVIKGNSGPNTGGNEATEREDLATGYGLADAYAAILKIRSQYH